MSCYQTKGEVKMTDGQANERTDIWNFDGTTLGNKRNFTLKQVALYWEIQWFQNVH